MNHISSQLTAGRPAVRDLPGSHLPAGARETSPLLAMLIGIAIPVGLLALAAVGGSVVVLVLAILAMLVVGATTLTFVMILASDPRQADGDE
jgi:hypothetical protein